VVAVAWAFARRHRDVSRLLLLATGILLLGTRGVLIEGSALDVPCSVLGAGCLVAANLMNTRATRRCCVAQPTKSPTP